MGGALGGKGSSTNEPNANASNGTINVNPAHSNSTAILRIVVADDAILSGFWTIRS
jgi:hypothetical protein